MTDITRKTTAYTAEGYITLGDLRRMVEQTREFDDSARVEAGFVDEADGIDQFDTLSVEGLLAEATIDDRKLTGSE